MSSDSRSIPRDAWWPVSVVCLAWTAVYIWRAIAAHASLLTNAYDLSVFDYAMWNLMRGQGLYVPFFGHSHLAHHVNPILALLAPVHAVWESPVLLIVVQTVAMGAAGALFFAAARRLGLDRWNSLGLVLVFLLCRRSHGASVSFFYPESMQPAFFFGMALAWLNARSRLVWLFAALALMTKEDAAFYVAAFAALRWVQSRDERRLATAVFAFALVWAVVSFGIVIPWARQGEGLGGASLAIDRFADSGGRISAADLVRRIVSLHSLSVVANWLAASGFLALLAPSWLVVTIPGLLIDLGVSPDASQSTAAGHYAFPMLPWFFLSAAAGLARLSLRWPRVARAWLILLVAGTALDTPVLRRLVPHVDPKAQEVLALIPNVEGRTVAAQPNLLPHLPYSNSIRSTSEDTAAIKDPEIVLLTNVGNLWPYSQTEWQALVDRYRRDPMYDLQQDGPLLVFRRRGLPR